VKAYDFLTSECSASHYAIVGYELQQTLSDHGTVNRGVCSINNQGDLVGVTERLNIASGTEEITCGDGLEPVTLQPDTMVSMNFWCFDPSVFDYSDKLFTAFLEERGHEEKSEFFIPLVADSFMRETGGRVEVIPTTALWFGVTYKEDAPAVKEGITKLLASGAYPAGLWR
jgi:hypothetical protein